MIQVLTGLLFLYIVSRPTVIIFLAKLSGKSLTPKGIRSMQKGQCILVGTLLAFHLADRYAESGVKNVIYGGLVVIDLLILIKSPDLFEFPVGGYTSLYGPAKEPDASKSLNDSDDKATED